MDMDTVLPPTKLAGQSHDQALIANFKVIEQRNILNPNAELTNISPSNKPNNKNKHKSEENKENKKPTSITSNLQNDIIDLSKEISLSNSNSRGSSIPLSDSLKEIQKQFECAMSTLNTNASQQSLLKQFNMKFNLKSEFHSPYMHPSTFKFFAWDYQNDNDSIMRYKTATTLLPPGVFMCGGTEQYSLFSANPVLRASNFDSIDFLYPLRNISASQRCNSQTDDIKTLRMTNIITSNIEKNTHYKSSHTSRGGNGPGSSRNYNKRFNNNNNNAQFRYHAHRSNDIADCIKKLKIKWSVCGTFITKPYNKSSYDSEDGVASFRVPLYFQWNIENVEQDCNGYYVYILPSHPKNRHNAIKVTVDSDCNKECHTSIKIYPEADSFTSTNQNKNKKNPKMCGKRTFDAMEVDNDDINDSELFEAAGNGTNSDPYVIDACGVGGANGGDTPKPPPLTLLQGHSIKRRRLDNDSNKRAQRRNTLQTIDVVDITGNDDDSNEHKYTEIDGDDDDGINENHINCNMNKPMKRRKRFKQKSSNRHRMNSNGNNENKFFNKLSFIPGLSTNCNTNGGNGSNNKNKEKSLDTNGKYRGYFMCLFVPIDLSSYCHDSCCLPALIRGQIIFYDSVDVDSGYPTEENYYFLMENILKTYKEKGNNIEEFDLMAKDLQVHDDLQKLFNDENDIMNGSNDENGGNIGITRQTGSMTFDDGNVCNSKSKKETVPTDDEDDDDNPDMNDPMFNVD